jgi:transposase
MDDVDCSKLFASIAEEEREAFFREWVQLRCEKECIVYDVSSISSYSGNIDIAEWGYNRDQDNLPQVNLGMYYGAASHLPVYYNIYSGSIPDKAYLGFMMANAKDLGIRGACFVVDRGFVTEENFLCMKEHEYSFITAMPGKRLEALRLIDESRGSIRKAANRLSGHELYSLQRGIELYGIPLHAHVYYDSEKQSLDEKELYSHIGWLRSELEKMSRSKRVTTKYKNYFVIDEIEKDRMTFELDMDKVDEKLGRTGFFILLSSKQELSSGEVLTIYRERDVIEKGFEQFKNRMDDFDVETTIRRCS